MRYVRYGGHRKKAVIQPIYVLRLDIVATRRLTPKRRERKMSQSYVDHQIPNKKAALRFQDWPKLCGLTGEPLKQNPDTKSK